jgi:hypothetical protein
VHSGEFGARNGEAVFDLLAWAPCGLHKKGARTRYIELVLLEPVQYAGYIVHSSTFGAQNMIALFFVLGCDRNEFHKKRARTRYAEIVFLHLVGPAGHVKHCGMSGARNMIALFSMLGWDRHGFDKNGQVYSTPNLCFCIRWDLRDMQCIPVRSGCEISTHYFSCSGGPDAVSIKSMPRHVTPNL